MVASRAYGVSGGFARPVRRARATNPLARNILIAGTALAAFACGSAALALLHTDDFAPAPYVASRTALKLALAEPSAPRIVPRDPRAPIETPNLTIVARKQARLDAPAREAARAQARAAAAKAAESVVQFSAARTAPAEPLARERPGEVAEETTGSLGELSPAARKLALAAIPEKPAGPAVPRLVAKPASLPASASAPAPRKPWRPLSPHEKLYGPVRLASLAPVAPDTSPLAVRPPFDLKTAVYVIADKTVYLPDGSSLEAHSGLGDYMDDPRFVKLRMRGATPPHVYDMKMRESLFHGVEAIRLTPVGGEDAIFGRTGLLAHSYMLGPNGQSNGCVSFKDYSAFLSAFKAGKITRLAVIPKLD
jgi:hypothetical protein